MEAGEEAVLEDRRKFNIKTHNLVPIITAIISATVALLVARMDRNKQTNQTLLIMNLIEQQNKVIDSYHEELKTIISGVDYKITNHLENSKYMSYKKLDKIKSEYNLKVADIEKTIEKNGTGKN